MLVDPGFVDIAAGAGRLYASWERADPDYTRAYGWMVAQMAARGLDTGGNPPFWAWHSYGGAGKRVDMRFINASVPLLRLTLAVPDELVLLSCFERWHFVLNNWYHSIDEADYAQAEVLEDAGKLDQGVKEESWLRIFDLSVYGDPAWNGSDDHSSIQACMPWFEHAWIRKVERFEPRPVRTKRARNGGGAG